MGSLLLIKIRTTQARHDGSGYAPPSPDASTLFAFSITMATKSFAGNIFIDGWDFRYKANRLGTDTEF